MYETPALPSRHTYRFDLAYDGSRFAGFQQQPGLRTVESVVLRALQPMVPELPRVAVAGRTDRGVHARGQVISFWSRTPLSIPRAVDAIEAAGAADLAVVAAREVPRVFHASFSARHRTYVYRLRAPDVDPGRLDSMLGALVGRRCFNAFARRTPHGQSTVRHMMSARACIDGPERVRIELTADRFLRRQVRVIVATALVETRNGAPPHALLELSERGDRAATAPPADPGGLCLTHVGY